MIRVIVALAGTVAGLVLLLSFKTHGTAAPTTATTAAVSTTKTAVATTTTAKKRTTTTSAAKTVTGDVSETQYGPVQVQVTVKNGTVTAVTATQSPSGDPRSQQINAYAIPALNQEALQAKSAGIAMVSGATYTSNGYIASLQSALSKAGIA